MKRYASDIRVRKDVIKVAVEHLDVTLDGIYNQEEEFLENEASSSNNKSGNSC